MLLALGVVTVGVAAPASAYQNTITPAVTCAADYTSQVTWSVINSESDNTETITASSDTTLVPLGTTVAAGETKTFTETVATPTAKTLTLDAIWSNGVTSHDTGSITNDQFTPACVAPQIKSTALYLYKKLDPTKDAAWENSGLQRKIISWDGWSYKTAYPGTLPSDVCGPDWGVQQDQINAAQSLFPTNVQYPSTGLFDAGVLHDARHDNLSSLMTVPDCAPIPQVTAEADPTPQTCADGMLVNGQIHVLLNSHLVYRIDGVVVTVADTTMAPGLHTVTAELAEPKGIYVLDGPASWTFDSAAYDGGCGLPTRSLVTSMDRTCAVTGSYTLGAGEGVAYTVNGTGQAPGTYLVPTAKTVTVVASISSSGFGLEAGAQTTWNLVFTDPGNCADVTAPAFTASDGTFVSTGSNDPSGSIGFNDPSVSTASNDPLAVTGSNDPSALTASTDPLASTGSTGTLAFTGSDGTLASGFLLGLVLVIFGGGVITVSRSRKRTR